MSKVLSETTAKSVPAAVAKPAVASEKTVGTSNAAETGSAQAGATADQSTSEPAQDRSAYHTSVPQNWDEIRVGSLILAPDVRAGFGWFEAVVTATTNDVLSLRWRDYPREPCKPRRRQEVALLFSGQ